MKSESDAECITESGANFMDVIFRQNEILGAIYARALISAKRVC